MTNDILYSKTNKKKQQKANNTKKFHISITTKMYFIVVVNWPIHNKMNHIHIIRK